MGPAWCRHAGGRNSWGGAGSRWGPRVSPGMCRCQAGRTGEECGHTAAPAETIRGIPPSRLESRASACRHSRHAQASRSCIPGMPCSFLACLLNTLTTSLCTLCRLQDINFLKMLNCYWVVLLVHHGVKSFSRKNKTISLFSSSILILLRVPQERA